MFKITEGRGFQITFSNGYTISAQFGIGNYCDNRSKTLDDEYDEYHAAQVRCGVKGSENCEIAVFSPNGDFYREAGIFPQEVTGWVTPDEFAEMVDHVSKLKGDCNDASN